MNKQVKININDKDYYCDMEVLKLIERLQDKVELLEYNRDEAIEKLENMKNIEGGTNSTILQAVKEVEETISILRGEE